MATKAYVPPHYGDDTDAYTADLNRELAGYRNRMAELKAMHVREDEGAYIDAESGEAAVLAVLASLKPKKAAAKK